MTASFTLPVAGVARIALRAAAMALLATGASAQASDAPIKLIGVGEGIDDLQPFDARAFSRSLVGLGE